MSYDLTDYFPFGPEDGFNEAGHTIKAWQPANDDAPHCFILQASKDGEIVKEVLVDMTHTNQWGVDTEDWNALERATDDLIVELGGESAWPAG